MELATLKMVVKYLMKKKPIRNMKRQKNVTKKRKIRIKNVFEM